MKTFRIVTSKAAAVVSPRLVFLSIVTLFLILIMLPSMCPAAQVNLDWDPNPDPAVIGYRVYYGTSSRFYTAAVDAGRDTVLTITGLLPGLTYYFAATD